MHNASDDVLEDLRMTRLTLIPFLVLICACLRAEDSEIAKPANESQALPKVPTLATVAGDGSVKNASSKWVQELMTKKETKARVEIVLLKQKLIAEQETKDVEEKDRARRKQLYDKALGTLFDAQAAGETKTRTIRMKLEFQVPEIEMYRRLVDVYKARSTLATSVVEAITKLERDNDGKTTPESYRDAAYIFIATQRLFLSVDNDGDGYIALSEIDAAKELPASAAAAMTAGANSKDATTGGALIIKGFDVDKDGVLNISERKALSSAYLQASLKSQQDADAYQKLLDELITARQSTAAKFENLTIELVESK